MNGGPWFDPNTFGWMYGSIVGGLGGTLGGCLGALAGVLAPKGKGKGVVIGSFVFCILFGLANLAFGIAALIASQPYGIWYPPMLIGFLFTLLFSILLPVVNLRYRQAEQRQMQAADFRSE